MGWSTYLSCRHLLNSNFHPAILPPHGQGNFQAAMEVLCLGCDWYHAGLVARLLYHDHCDVHASGSIVESIRSYVH